MNRIRERKGKSALRTKRKVEPSGGARFMEEDVPAARQLGLTTLLEFKEKGAEGNVMDE